MKKLVGTGVCHCGADMGYHEIWGSHTPVEMMVPEDDKAE